MSVMGHVWTAPLYEVVAIRHASIPLLSNLFGIDHYSHEYRFQHKDGSEETNASDEPIREEACKRGQGKSILVLEDDPDVRSFVVAVLIGLGYRVLEAADANAAMQVLEEEAGNADLLLCDVVLPHGVGGPELAVKAKDFYP